MNSSTGTHTASIVRRPSADELVDPAGPCYCARCMETRNERFAESAAPLTLDAGIRLAQLIRPEEP